VTTGADGAGERLRICRQHGLKDETELYQLVNQARSTGVAQLLACNLRAPILSRLGYTESNLRKLGLTDAQLADLGFPRKSPAGTTSSQLPAAPSPTTQTPPQNATESMELDEGQRNTIQQMIKSGIRAPEMKQRGWTVGHLRKAGINPVELERCGFQLDELAQWYPAAELRRFGYGARELRRLFRPQELRAAGFSATDLRNSGATIRELLAWGYSENDVRTAGFSIVELQREGLSKQTVDHSRKYR
jgi:intracellular multiplication protein IcmE